MEQNFQTSFIPKKPMVEERPLPSGSTSIFKILAVFVLFTVLIASGGLYVYKGMLTKNLAQMKIDLDLAKERFEPATIYKLQTLDRRLSAATTVLAKHISISPIFEALQENTMKTVRYTKFNYEITSDPNPVIKVMMSGQAIEYASVALQSDLFKKNKNIIDPVFSNLSLDDKGNVNFELQFSVDPKFVNYKESLAVESDKSANLTTDSTEVVN